MGQTDTDHYYKASSEAAHAALKTIHAFEESLSPAQAELLKGCVLTLTKCNPNRKNRPSVYLSEEPSIIAEREATSGNLTSFIRIRKLVTEVRPVRDENGKLPHPFSTPTIIPSDLSSVLAELEAIAPEKAVFDGLLSGQAVDLSALLNRQLTKAESDILAKGKLQALTFDGFLNAMFKKRFGFMGSGFLAINSWNESYSNNKWVLHVHDDGRIFAEYLCLTNYIRRNG